MPHGLSASLSCHGCVQFILYTSRASQVQKIVETIVIYPRIDQSFRKRYQYLLLGRHMTQQLLKITQWAGRARWVFFVSIELKVASVSLAKGYICWA